MKKYIIPIMLLFSFLVLAIPTHAGITDNGVIAYYTFEETSGTKVVNVGNLTNNNATAVGTTANVTGFVGKARNYSGNTGNYVNSTLGALADGGQYTINMWIKNIEPMSATTSFGFFATKNINGFRVEGAGGADYYRLASSAGITGDANTTLTKAQSFSWVMFTAVVNQTGGRIYVNGTYKMTFVKVSEASWFNQFIMGFAYDNGEIRMHNGTIDEVGLWSRQLNNTEVEQIYNYSVAGLQFPFTATPTSNNITFYSQVPSDLTSTTIFNTNLNITYNYSIVGLTSPYLNYTTYSDGLSCIQTINGTCVRANNTYTTELQSSNVTSGNNSLISYSLNENDIYPYVANLNDTYFNQAHTNYTSTGTNDYYSTEFLNVSNITTYNIFEIQAISTGVARVYACNNSYAFNNQVATDINCQEIGLITSTTYNHTHGTYSKHNIIPFVISNGRIAGTGVRVTNNMYFMIRGLNGATLTIGYVTNFTRTNAIRTSNNGGNTWSGQTYTTDSHIHQFTNDTYLKYAGVGTYGGTLNSTAFTTDLFDLTTLPPEIPIILNPFNNQNVSSRYLNITYTNATPTTAGVTIRYYNITLLNADYTLNRTIQGNNSLNNSYYYDLYAQNLTANKTYAIKVEATDSVGLSSYNIEEFTLLTNHLLNVSAIDDYYNTSVGNFTLDVLNMNTGELTNYATGTTNKSIFVDVIRGVIYNITIDAVSYAYETDSVTIPQNASSNYVFEIFKTNSVYVNILDETSGSPILNSCNVSFTGTTLLYNYTTNTSTLFVENLTADNYAVTFNCALYSTRQYFITITNRSTQTLNAYLTQSSTAVLLSFTDKDTGVVLEGVSVGLSKMINGSLTLVESRLTDVTGRTQFVVATTTAYTFTNTLTGYTTKIFSLNPVLFTSYNVQMEKSGSAIPTLDLQDISVSFYPTDFVKTNNTFTFVVNSPNGALTNYGYRLVTQCKNVTTFTGTNAYGSTNVSIFNLSCAGNYDTLTLTYFYTTSGEEQRNFTRIFGIASTANNATFAHTLDDDTYGMGLFERVIITTIISIVLMGVVASIGGMVSGLVVGLIILAYFVNVGFIPLSIVIITLFVGTLIIMAFNSNR